MADIENGQPSGTGEAFGLEDTSDSSVIVYGPPGSGSDGDDGGDPGPTKDPLTYVPWNLSLARSVSPTTRLMSRVNMRKRMKKKMKIALKTVPTSAIKGKLTV